MKNYTKPIVIANEELAESVYMASGNSDCYTVNTWIHQTPQQGRGDYRIQANATHAAADAHHSGEQILTLTFNMPVAYVGSNGSLVSGDGSNVIKIAYGYHNNGNDYVGLGDVIVTADAGLAILSSSLSCNYDCGQH